MGGLFQLAYLLGMAAIIFAVFMVVAFLVSRIFQSKKARKRIMVWAMAIYGLGFVGYFGFIAFILSGRLN